MANQEARLEVEQFEELGALRVVRAIDKPGIQRLAKWAAARDTSLPGERVSDIRPLAWLLDEAVVGRLARDLLGQDAKPVRAILFDKSRERNWALGWHQDRTIAVRERADVAGFGRWSVKAGVQHVEPPFELIERMVTMRVHLDPVNATNAPLHIAPGSHRLGRILEAEIDNIVEGCGQQICFAETGDVWVYRTAILHSSARSLGDGRRRVLQVDYSADQLPDPLEWYLV